MKIKHLLIAIALVAAAAACSADVTEPRARPDGPSDTEGTTTTSSSAPDTVPRDGGLLGSGGGK
jgi:ABC-type glycerol-3-phosphate transport system substrate-binding protein